MTTEFVHPTRREGAWNPPRHRCPMQVCGNWALLLVPSGQMVLPQHLRGRIR
jgi:hypothetical protein